MSEVPFKVCREDAANPVWVRDFEATRAGDVDLEAVEGSFIEAFQKVWRGEVENDRFNRLVLAAGLDYRQVILLRAYGRYLRQIGTAFSEPFMARALALNPEIVRRLMALFAATFDPDREDGSGREDGAGREDERSELRRGILEALEEVENALVGYAKERIRRNHLARAVDASQRSVDLVRTQYMTGLTNFQNVLDSERSLTNQQDQLAESEGEVIANLISLYRALGGGWEPDPENEETYTAPIFQ